MRLRCTKCGRFIKLQMKAPIFASTAHNAEPTGWSYSGYCGSCSKWQYKTEMVKADK